MKSFVVAGSTLVWLAGGLLSSPCVCAQEWQAAIKRAAGKAVSAAQAKRSAAVVKQVEKALLQSKKAWLHHVYKQPTDLPDDFCLNSTDNWICAWVQRSNRLALSERLFKENLSRRLADQKQKLLENLVRLPPQHAHGWAKRIAPEAKIIFIGEYHLPKMQTYAARLIQAYQRRYPTRQIIVLTEFAADEFPHFLSAQSKKRATYLKQFFSLLPDKQIQVAGLEEPSCIQTRIFSDQDVHIGGTALGIAVRNEHWLKRIRQWQKRYPNAVFFVYTGGGHCELRELFSLAHAFPARESFVISFLPAGNLPMFQDVEMLHAFTQGQLYRPGVLVWKDRLAGRFVGFDMQIIVSAR